MTDTRFNIEFTGNELNSFLALINSLNESDVPKLLEALEDKIVVTEYILIDRITDFSNVLNEQFKGEKIKGDELYKVPFRIWEMTMFRTMFEIFGDDVWSRSIMVVPLDLRTKEILKRKLTLTVEE